MSYLESIKGKHVEDLRLLLQNSLNMPDVNNLFVGAIHEELSNRGIKTAITATVCGLQYVVDIEEVGSL